MHNAYADTPRVSVSIKTHDPDLLHTWRYVQHFSGSIVLIDAENRGFLDQNSTPYQEIVF